MLVDGARQQIRTIRQASTVVLTVTSIRNYSVISFTGGPLKSVPTLLKCSNWRNSVQYFSTLLSKP
jgi:hypothetical protein